ncbi:MAG: VOC family protein [Nocardioides sp.]
MSDEGWRAFLAADGLDDWVVLHGGATAVFGVASLAEGARLAAALGEVESLAGQGVLLTVGDDAVTVRLSRRVFMLERRHVEMARSISAVAREHGAVANRARTQEVQLAISAQPAETDVDFWRATLGYTPGAADNATDPLGHGSTFWLQELDPTRPLRHAMHVDVSLAREHARARVDAAVAAGGRIVDDSEAPQFWTLSDRAGNRVCIAAWPDGATMAPSEEQR